MCDCVKIGGSQINGRLNYSNRTTQNFCGTIFINCNEIPEIDPLDSAIKDRLRIFKFSSRFTLDPREVDEANGIFLRLSKFRSFKFVKVYGLPLFHIMMEYLQQYLRYVFISYKIHVNSAIE